LSFPKDVGRKKLKIVHPLERKRRLEKRKRKNGSPIEKKKHLIIHPFQRNRRLGSM